jgi:AraC-like DNA-binding protein
MKILKSGTYYGQEMSFLNQPGIKLSEYRYLNPRTEWHYHENPYFMYIIQGQLMDINKSAKTHCPQGSLVFHNWQEPHLNTRESATAKGFHIEFDRNWFDSRKLKGDLWEGSKLLKDPRTYHILARIYYEFNCRDRFTEISLESLILQLCEVIEKNEHHGTQAEPAWVNRLRAMVWEENIELSLKSLSGELGVHPVHLCRALPKYLKITLGDYIRHTRVRKSLELLPDARYSLTEIAYSCGFSDQSHFNRTFRKLLSVSPGSYRKQILHPQNEG